MKNRKLFGVIPPCYFFKLYRIMRMGLFLLLLAIFNLHAENTYSQSASLSFSLKNTTIEQVLDQIERETEFNFLILDKALNIKKAVDIQARDEKIETVLDNLFRDTNIEYRIMDRQIVLMPRQSAPGIAQQSSKQIAGKIMDERGDPVIGANVVEKGTTNGVITDMDGNFTLAVSPSAIIQISYIGYITQEIPAGSITSFTNIRLVEDLQALNEVVVVGYGTVRRGELTSAISSVKSESFIKGAVQDAAQLLQGKVAGLGVVLPNGDPTATTQIMLRGVSTLRSSTSPLVIIDGVPGELSTVATEDIESIDIVKDGSAAAIYGTRGNNGVLFITTKKVRGEMPPTVEVNAYITTQQIKKKLNIMNAGEYRELVAQGVAGAIDYGHSTDWLDEVTRTPFSYVTNVSLRGGGNRTNYIGNINYRSNEGIIKRSDNKVFTSRLEINHSMWEDLLKFNVTIMGKEQRYNMLDENSGFRGSVYRNTLINNPTERPKDDEGSWVEHTEIYLYENPLALLYETTGERKDRQIRSFGTVTFTPIPQLFVKALGSHTTFNSMRGYAESQNHISTIRDNRNGYASRRTVASTDNLLEITAQYKESFGKHALTVLGGYSYQDNINENFFANNWDFPSDQYTYNNLASGAALKRGEASETSYKEESRLIGFFGRVNYSFDDRYLFSASVRREGSTKFGEDHKWGTFPAFSVGWNISNEAFMSETRDVLSNLKVRLGFGVTGTIPDDSYISLSQLGTGSNFYTENGWIPTLKPSSNANPDLRWEKKEEWNLGLDYGFLGGRLSGTFDVYKRKTKDMLWEYQVALPPYLYSTVIANAGTMENKGFEAGITIIPIQTADFAWSTTVNYSTNSNKLVSLSNDRFQLQSGFIDAGNTGEPIQQVTHRLYEGGKVGDFYGYKVIDIDDDGRWIIEDKDGNPKPIIEQQPDDKHVLGNGLPKHFLSWSNTLNYKGFQLSILMRGAFGFDILNTPRMFYDNPIWLARGNLMNTAFDPKLNGKALGSTQELQYVSYYIEKGDYWKIDNIMLGYTLDLRNKYLQKVNVYVTGNNLFTITGYSGIDPEVRVNGLDPGSDLRERYPSTRTFTIGTILTF